jgi:glycosyl transferase family 25
MPAFAEYFERTYVISLAERRDRQAEMDEQLQRIGLRLGAGNVALFSAIRPADKGEFETPGARGCFLSHLAVLEDAVKRSCARVVVLEDDLNFARDFAARIDEVLRALGRAPWSLFYGGHRIEGPKPGGLWPVPPTTEVATSHFVAFQGAAIARAADTLRRLARRPAGHPQGGAMHVDGAYNWYRRLHPSELALAAVPELGYQRSSRTDVHRLGWADSTPLVKDTIAGLRRLRNRVISR